MQSNFSVSSDLSSTKDEQKCSSFALSLLSPAKINLFFRVLSKRDDGYHEIASLYQAISLFDKVQFAPSSSLQFSCSDPALAIDKNNLVVKAADLFFQTSGCHKNVSIHLTKNIPMQAGLGGGSANAATVLYGLNSFYDFPLKDHELTSLGAQIGSDVAFFFSSGSAYCTGRGEVFEDISIPRIFDQVTIVKPWYGLSTPLVFNHTSPNDLQQRDPKESLKAYVKGDPLFYNDLETPAFSILPQLKTLKSELLSRGFSNVVLCGSGTSFFCTGCGDLSGLENCSVFHVAPIYRNTRQWYELA